ncbi:MAG: xanthine dehydrogenase molybdopterin binding subunit [Syntrophothermus sp.]
MMNYDVIRHVKGESLFLDDLPCPENLLHAAIFPSPKACGIIKKLDISGAINCAGVRRIITAEDIPGENQIGGIVQDEKLLASEEVDFAGQPVAIVIADTPVLARRALKEIKIELEEHLPVLDPREACSKGMLIIPPRIFSSGNADDAWQQCKHIIEGQADSGAQEHVYLETQGAMAIPLEGGNVKIFSSTQGPTQVQRAAARVLGLSMNQVEVDVSRIGGGFGGKEDQANAYGAMAALASVITGRPVKLILNRQEDIRYTGKRHSYSTDYKIGLSEDGKILAYEVIFYQNAGAAADLSPAILDRTLFHCTNAYYIPNVKATGYSCRTNIAPATAFRGFGGPQGMFAIESALMKASEKTGIPVRVLQEANLIKEEEMFHYGQQAENCRAKITWNCVLEKFDVAKWEKEIEEFNGRNKLYKKGLALMPICFGISFTNTFMNQASALVHVYSDGSISVSTGAVEMGQGVNMKLRQAAAGVLGVSPERVKIDTSNTSRAANTSPTAASSGADLNGQAVQLACAEILKRIKEFAARGFNSDPEKIKLKDEHVYVSGKKQELNWTSLIREAFFNRVNLSAHANFATPKIYFDKETLKGRAFNYHVYGTAVVEAGVDCLKGQVKINKVRVVHDFGSSINRTIDLGQAEGALLQGLGWMTMEEIVIDEKGILKTDSLSAYKVPDIYSVPEVVDIHFLENADNPPGLMNSKAIGEPPLMYGIGSYFAIINAMKAFRKGKTFNLPAPLTNERVLMALYEK